MYTGQAPPDALAVFRDADEVTQKRMRQSKSAWWRSDPVLREMFGEYLSNAFR